MNLYDPVKSISYATCSRLLIKKGYLASVRPGNSCFRVQLFIGEESGYDVLDDCTVVTSTYESEHKTLGVLGDRINKNGVPKSYPDSRFNCKNVEFGLEFQKLVHIFN